MEGLLFGFLPFPFVSSFSTPIDPLEAMCQHLGGGTAGVRLELGCEHDGWAFALAPGPGYVITHDMT